MKTIQAQSLIDGEIHMVEVDAQMTVCEAYRLFGVDNNPGVMVYNGLAFERMEYRDENYCLWCADGVIHKDDGSGIVYVGVNYWRDELQRLEKKIQALIDHNWLNM